MLKENADLKLEIGGHTDSDGSSEANLKLSEERAKSVRTALVEMGIEESRLSVKGFGSSKPVNDNSSAENKARNRRVEFVKK
jgi:outer membrane protein OmpA-like peptidoglycan-associated protein